MRMRIFEADVFKEHKLGWATGTIIWFLASPWVVTAGLAPALDPTTATEPLASGLSIWYMILIWGVSAALGSSFLSSHPRLTCDIIFYAPTVITILASIAGLPGFHVWTVLPLVLGLLWFDKRLRASFLATPALAAHQAATDSPRSQLFGKLPSNDDDKDL